MPPKAGADLLSLDMTRRKFWLPVANGKCLLVLFGRLSEAFQLWAWYLQIFKSVDIEPVNKECPQHMIVLLNLLPQEMIMITNLDGLRQEWTSTQAAYNQHITFGDLQKPFLTYHPPPSPASAASKSSFLQNVIPASLPQRMKSPITASYQLNDPITSGYVSPRGDMKVMQPPSCYRLNCHA